MQGDREIIRTLNAVLTNELTAVNQYFLHARMLQNWGFERLGKIVYDESIGEMRHADKLIKRILFLGGAPRLEFDKLLIGNTVPEVLECDLRLEQQAIPQLREAIPYCERVHDFVTRDLFSEILVSEEQTWPDRKHSAWDRVRAAVSMVLPIWSSSKRRRKGWGGAASVGAPAIQRPVAPASMRGEP